MRAGLRKALPVLVAFLIGAMFVGAAWATTTLVRGNLTVSGTVKAKKFVYAHAQTVLYNVPGSAFTADTFNGTAVGHNDYSGEVVVPAGNDAVAPVQLPQGAIVTKVTVVTDGLTDGQMSLHLESNTFAGSHDDMVDIESPTPSACGAAPCTLSTTTIAASTIDNKTRTYGLWLFNNDGLADLTLIRVAIYYKVTAAGPAAAGRLTGVVDAPGTDSNG
ncbi:MAG: hypothetical protein HY240_06780 [Actinobacteria bacterium]|nr:hypothetical protein [Actinomycetota bacterium]